MKYYQAVGFAQIKGKDKWDVFKDSAVFACPEDQNPYEFLCKDYATIFEHWLVEFKETLPPVKGVD